RDQPFDRQAGVDGDMQVAPGPARLGHGGGDLVEGGGQSGQQAAPGLGRFRRAGKSADRARHVARRRFPSDRPRVGAGDDRLLRLQLLSDGGAGRAAGGGHGDKSGRGVHGPVGGLPDLGGAQPVRRALDRPARRTRGVVGGGRDLRPGPDPAGAGARAGRHDCGGADAGRGHGRGAVRPGLRRAGGPARRRGEEADHRRLPAGRLRRGAGLAVDLGDDRDPGLARRLLRLGGGASAARGLVGRPGGRVDGERGHRGAPDRPGGVGKGLARGGGAGGDPAASARRPDRPCRRQGRGGGRRPGAGGGQRPAGGGFGRPAAASVRARELWCAPGPDADARPLRPGGGAGAVRRGAGSLGGSGPAGLQRRLPDHVRHDLRAEASRVLEHGGQERIERRPPRRLAVQSAPGRRQPDHRQVQLRLFAAEGQADEAVEGAVDPEPHAGRDPHPMIGRGDRQAHAVRPGQLDP
uniref:Long-chain-fatty-acid--CoA ligase n=1 Tax=Parastrongyloides trichosuri TaxID=131310 RepID=A0A0N4Z5G0_PARTI